MSRTGLAGDVELMQALMKQAAWEQRSRWMYAAVDEPVPRPQRRHRLARRPAGEQAGRGGDSGAQPRVNPPVPRPAARRRAEQGNCRPPGGLPGRHGRLLPSPRLEDHGVTVFRSYGSTEHPVHHRAAARTCAAHDIGPSWRAGWRRSLISNRKPAPWESQRSAGRGTPGLVGGSQHGAIYARALLQFDRYAGALNGPMSLSDRTDRGGRGAPPSRQPHRSRTSHSNWRPP
jgi:hypothetical protein